VTQVNTGTGAKGIVRVNVPAATARLVPVSDGTNYLPVTINAPNASGYNVTVFNGLTTNSAPNGTAFSAAAKSECVDAVWNVNLANGVGTGVNIALGWPASLEGSKFAAITSNALIGLSHSQAGIWDSPTFGSGSYPTNSAARTVAVVASSSFAVGTVYPAGGILPIKVNYFNAAKGNGYNTLNWSAVSTSDQMIFDIERSADGKNFTAINSITATRLDCLQPFNYVDNSNLSGTVYYRIKITDFNGKVTYSSVVRIATPQTDMKLVGVLPNPVSNTAQLNVVSDKKDNVQLYVVSMTGQLVQRSTVQLQPGSSIINLDVTNLQNGMYTIKGTFSNGTVSAVKFIKQ
ncbi:MAG: T9SS type A sorting domain-containing protein, partial [Ferruginibacter sp.]